MKNITTVSLMMFKVMLLTHHHCGVQLCPVTEELLELRLVAVTGGDQGPQSHELGLTVLQVLQYHLHTHTVGQSSL